MDEILLPPVAPTLLESLRAVGYSFETAIADLIDNSISAGAHKIRIESRPFGDPYVALFDNGSGMGRDELLFAMRHGSRHPSHERDPEDLGRFGLGLKTASLSQCRKMTLISLKDGHLSAGCWDLDFIAQRNDWVLQGLSEHEAQAKPHIADLMEMGQGTLVIWEELDKLQAGYSNLARRLGDLLDRARDHLALVFHRYLSAEGTRPRIEIYINNNRIEPLDPFLISHTATQPLPEEVLEVEGSRVRVLPYILPHLSKLSQEQRRIAGGEEGLRRNQGFYIYRNRRLITWGTWFRLSRQEELTKLARVMVEIPNSLDHFWTLDIKKSTASPPEAVRQGLRRIIERIGETSRQVYRYRGRLVSHDTITHTWERILSREGILYRINRDHPLLQTLKAEIPNEQLSLLDSLLDSLEVSFPFDAVYVDMAADRRIERHMEVTREAEMLSTIISSMFEALSDDPEAAERLLQSIPSMEPFVFFPEQTKEILQRLTQ
jgi:hypothetical protein